MRKGKNLQNCLLISLCILAISSVTHAQKTVYVRVGGSGTGTSWADATDFYGADYYSDPCDEVWVAAGTYTPIWDYYSIGSDPCSRENHFRMMDGVAIYGGFPDTGTAVWEDRDPGTYITTLSGDLLENDVPVGDPCDLLNDPCRADNCYHVFYHPDGLNLDSTAILDGFTITGGNANFASADHDHGGGMHNYHNSPTVTNCIFTENSAAVYGGGVANFEALRPTD